jgi:hypothetical protein
MRAYDGGMSSDRNPTARTGPRLAVLGACVDRVLDAIVYGIDLVVRDR